MSRPRCEESILVDGVHPPIIDIEIFETAQYYMSQNPPRPVKEDYNIKNPLSGLLVCGMCEHAMIRKPSKKYGETLLCTSLDCKNVSSKLDVVERKVLSSLEDWVQQYKIQEQSSNVITMSNYELTTCNHTISQLDEELQTLDSQLNTAYDLLERGIYTPEVFAQRTQNVSSRIAETSLKKSKLVEEREKISYRIKSSQDIIPQIEYVLSIYDTLDSPQEKNALLSSILEKIVYTKLKGGRWSDPQDFDIQVFPRLPKV